MNVLIAHSYGGLHRNCWCFNVS